MIRRELFPENYTEGMKKPRLSRLEENRMMKRLHDQDYQKLYLIFTEGTKTEPYYFEGFKKAIESTGRKSILIEVVGVGRATTQLLKAADEFIETFQIENAEVWLLSDKDEFPDSQFNELILQAKKRDREKFMNNYWHCGWSNECFELWFILHFSFYQAAANRNEYFRMLKEQFRKLKLGDYKKNSADIFRILTEYGNPKLALAYAKKLYREKERMNPSRAVPCTTVYQLVEELARYLPADLKARYF